MKCLDDVEKEIQLEKELARLLSTASCGFLPCVMSRSIADSSSIITYIMVFLKQMPGDLATLKQTLKTEVNIFLLSGGLHYIPLQIDTDRIVDSLFAFIETLESDGFRVCLLKRGRRRRIRVIARKEHRAWQN